MQVRRAPYPHLRTTLGLSPTKNMVSVRLGSLYFSLGVSLELLYILSRATWIPVLNIPQSCCWCSNIIITAFKRHVHDMLRIRQTFSSAS